MLYSLKELNGYQVLGDDGPIGRIDSFYLEEESWVMRYVVVDTTPGPFGRRVLLATTALEAPDREKRAVHAYVTQEQVRNSPDIDTTLPISRQQQAVLSSYYGWPSYWTLGGPNYPGRSVAPEVDVNAVEMAASAAEVTEGALVPQLYNTGDLDQSHVEALDGPSGHVDDVVVDDKWKIRFLVIDTQDWRPSQDVLVATEQVERISWASNEIFVRLIQEQVAASPAFDRERLEQDLAPAEWNQPGKGAQA